MKDLKIYFSNVAPFWRNVTTECKPVTSHRGTTHLFRVHVQTIVSRVNAARTSKWSSLRAASMKNVSQISLNSLLEVLFSLSVFLVWRLDPYSRSVLFLEMAVSHILNKGRLFLVDFCPVLTASIEGKKIFEKFSAKEVPGLLFNSFMDCFVD